MQIIYRHCDGVVDVIIALQCYIFCWSLLMCMYKIFRPSIQRKLERDFVQNGAAPPTTDEIPDEGEEEDAEEEIDEIATVSGIFLTAATKLLGYW